MISQTKLRLGSRLQMLNSVLNHRVGGCCEIMCLSIVRLLQVMQHMQSSSSIFPFESSYLLLMDPVRVLAPWSKDRVGLL